jgi:hypothetical protein
MNGTPTAWADHGLAHFPSAQAEISILRAFYEAQIEDAKRRGLLLSLHLKATMMKVSDPIIFGHVVRAFFADVFDTYGAQLTAAGLNGNNGLGAILAGLGGYELLAQVARQQLAVAALLGAAHQPAHAAGGPPDCRPRAAAHLHHLRVLGHPARARPLVADPERIEDAGRVAAGAR